MYPNDTKYFKGVPTTKPLQHNDVISFGFNIIAVYDKDHESAFVYRLIKREIDIIDIDSEDEKPTESTSNDDDKPTTSKSTADADAPTTSKSTGDAAKPAASKCPAADDEVIDLSSDSDDTPDSNENEDYGTAPRINFVDDVLDSSDATEQYASGSGDGSGNGSDNASSDDEGSFVREATIHQADDDDTSPEIISLDDESSSAKVDQEENAPTENEAATLHSDKSPQSQQNSSNTAGTSKESNGTGDAASTDTGPSNEDKDASEVAKKPHEERLTLLKERLEKNIPKKRKIVTIKAKAIKRRRKTLTEAEYTMHRVEIREEEELKKERLEQKRKRRELLAKQGNDQKAKRDAAAESAATNRPVFVPKVKNATVSRGEQLCTDMLALQSNN